ncbi:MAG: VOC family protein, partial [Pseudomonadota bacterium]
MNTAIRDFEALGFTMTKGAESDSGHNALIVFEDGTYIELMHFPKAKLQSFMLAVTRPLGLVNLILSGEKEILRRFILHWKNAPRGHWVDWCFAATPIDHAVAHARRSGIMMTEASYAHERPNAEGETAKWRMNGTTEPSIPFLVEDFPEAASRAPIPDTHAHTNGAVKLKQVIIGSPDPDETLNHLSALTGAQIVDNQVEVNGVLFTCEPEAERNFAGPKELILSTGTNKAEHGLLDTRKTGGARIRLVTG